MTARLLVPGVAVLVALISFGAPAGASVPGGEGRIAFASTRDGNAELYSVWPDGSGARRLTWTSATEQSPAWAPDLFASKIAYESDESGRFRINVMDWDGRNQRRVSPEGSELDEDVHPTWSPDSKQLAFASTRGGGWHIWTMNADGTGLRRLTEGVDPAWSSNGQWIAYSWDESIWLVNRDGSNPQRMTVPDGRSVSAPAWSPFSHELVFSRLGQDGFPGELFVTGLAFWGQERQLTSGGFSNARPSWSPDSSDIVFQRRTPVGGWQLLAIPAGGGATREIQPSGGGDLTPGWGSSVEVPAGVAPAAPTIEFYSPTEGEDFWQGQDTPALYRCTSATAVVVSCEGDVPLGSPLDTSTAGPRTFNVRARDHEGRESSASVTYRVVDVVSPLIDLRTPQDGGEYELGEHVTVDYTCTDPGGQIAYCEGELLAGEPLPTDVVGTYTFRVFASDYGHNSTQALVTYRVVDLTPPSIVIETPADGATYPLGAPISASFSCEDPSGVVQCQGDATVATDVGGPQTFTVTATDRYWNTTSASHAYNVVYPFSGFFAPLASTAARFAAGKPIPVKFALGGDQGLSVLSPDSPTWQQIPCGSSARDGGTTPASGRLSYNEGADRYLYLLETKPAWAGTCRELVLTLNDGTSHPVVIVFDS
jgi:dipeptidyl aminopeptidase/acylaminoacyl peptidase